MKKNGIILSALMLLLLLPQAANASPGKAIYFVLEGGKAWGQAFSGPLASGRIFLPLSGGFWVQAGYNHYFEPTMWDDPSGNRRSAFIVGLQFKSRERGRLFRWFVHCDAGSFSSNLRSEPGANVREFGFGLGGGLERPLSGHVGLRCDIRGWSLYSSHVGFLSDDAWLETSLGFFIRL